MGQDDGGTRRLLVDAEAVPEVFVRVVDAKRYLETGEAQTAAEAARIIQERLSIYVSEQS